MDDGLHITINGVVLNAEQAKAVRLCLGYTWAEAEKTALHQEVGTRGALIVREVPFIISLIRRIAPNG